MKKFFIILGILIVVFGGIFVIVKQGSVPIFFSVQEYIPRVKNCKGEVDKNYFLEKSSDFEIGANIKGEAVFKHPNKAFKRLINDYGQVLKKIEEENHLAKISKKNYRVYMQYGWQVSGTDDEQAQGQFVTKFLDIYENSFL